jgi:hypothetical protein
MCLLLFLLVGLMRLLLVAAVVEVALWIVLLKVMGWLLTLWVATVLLQWIPLPRLWTEDGMTPCELCIVCNMSAGYGVNVILEWTWDWVSRARTVLVLVMLMDQMALSLGWVDLMRLLFLLLVDLMWLLLSLLLVKAVVEVVLWMVLLKVMGWLLTLWAATVPLYGLMEGPLLVYSLCHGYLLVILMVGI